MKARFLHRFLFAAALLPWLMSCVRDVTMDALEEPTVVVECILTDDPVQTLYLTYTKGASRDQAPELPEATAVLTDLTEGKEAGRFTRAADGTWQLSYAAIPEHRYRLDVSIPDHDPVWAEQTMPAASEIEVHWDWWRMNLPKSEPYRQTRGYVFSLDTLRSPVWFYGINYPDAESAGEMTELLCTDYPDVDGFNAVPSYYWPDDESALWGCWFRTSTYPELKDAQYHQDFLRFPVREGGRTEFLVSGKFRNYLSDPTDFIHSQKRFAELHYFSASEDYDRYLMESHMFLQTSSSSDLADIFLRDNVYTNIQGAVGFFGAKVERVVRWDDDQFWGGGPISFPYMAKGEIPLVPNWFDKTSPEYTDYDIAQGLSSHKPFTLLDFEIRAGFPKEWTCWKEIEYNHDPSRMSDAPTRKDTLYRIENEAQMKEHGLDYFGSVDFSTKNVLVVYVSSYDYTIPFLIDWQVEENRDAGYCYMCFHVAELYQQTCTPSINLPYLRIYKYITTRVALVVDKYDESQYSKYFLKYDRISMMKRDFVLELDIMPQFGITEDSFLP